MAEADGLNKENLRQIIQAQTQIHLCHDFQRSRYRGSTLEIFHHIQDFQTIHLEY